MTAIFLPLMVEPQPDTAERVRLAVQSIPFALDNMLPEQAAFDQAHRGPVDAVLGGNHGLTAVSHANGPDRGFRQFAAAVTLAVKATLPSLSDLIRHVVGMRAKEQVGRIHAGRHVALVEDGQAIGNCPAKELVGNSVGKGDGALLGQRHLSVSTHASLPRPTRIGPTGFVGVVVETLLHRPVTRALESFRGIGSHLLAPSQQRLVRAGIALSTRFRPAFSTIPSDVAKGLSLWR